MKNHFFRVFLSAVVCALCALLLTGVCWAAYRMVSHRTKTMTICGEEFDRSCLTLDLSGRRFSDYPDDWKKLLEMNALQYADLTDTGLTPEQYDVLHASLPECGIRWSVPVGDAYYPSDIAAFTLDASISPSDLGIVGYFSELRTLDARNYPLCDGLYDLAFGNEERARKCRLLLDDTLYGKNVTDSTERLDLSHAPVRDTAEFYDKLRFFPNLKKIYVGDVTMPDEEMDTLNKSFPETEIVWLVEFSIWQVRTDIKVFSTQVGDLQTVKINQQALEPLVRYCTALEALDLGHNLLTDARCLAGLKNLNILILSFNRLSDISVLRSLPKIHFLEIRNQPNIDDLSPLAYLTELEQIELQHLRKVKNMSAVMHCKKLRNLFAYDVDFDDCTLEELKAACPACLFDMESDYTKRAWQNTDKNMIIRALFENWARVDTETYNGWNDVRFTDKPTCGWKYKDRKKYL